MTRIAEQFDLMPPHSAEAEFGVLSSMLLGIDAVVLALQYLHRESFYSLDNQIIFDAIVKLHRGGKPVDIVLVRDELKRNGMWDEIGGAEYMTQIMSSEFTAAFAEHYAKIVQEKFMRRQLIAESNDLIRKAYAGEETGSEIASRAAGRIAEVASHGSVNDARLLGDVTQEVYDSLGRDECPRIKTDLFEIDDVIGGLPIGGFTLIGGRPGMGKSLLLKQIMRNVAARNVACGLVTIEESARKVAINGLSATSGVENHKLIFNRNLAREDWMQMADAIERTHKDPFWVDEHPVNLHEVEAAVIRLAMKHKCKLIGVDYLQCIDAGIEQETREVTIISRALKLAFKRLKVAGIAAVQLNRGNETGQVRPPVLKDLRGSGALEQDGDLVMLLHREDYYNKAKDDFVPTHKLEVHIEKNKDNTTAIVPLRFLGRTQEIRNYVLGESL